VDKDSKMLKRRSFIGPEKLKVIEEPMFVAFFQILIEKRGRQCRVYGRNLLLY